MDSRPAPHARARWLGGLLPAVAALLSGGCVVTLENDARILGGNDDRWYTGGWRVQRDVPADVPEGEASWLDAGATAAAGWLELLPAPRADDPAAFTSVSLVAGQQFFTPADLDASTLLAEDRPYAGWLYAGIARYDTWLDRDALRRRDVEHALELDVGIVGPASYADKTQSALHGVLSSEEPEGWEHQLDNEPGLVLRASRSARDLYAEAASGLAFDAISRFGGALGNVDTHLSLGETLRLGLNLPRNLDEQAGDRRRLRPGQGRTGDEGASVYLFTGVEGRFVARNLFLDGNSFQSSHDIDKEELVGVWRVGAAWEWDAWRVAYTRITLTDEFQGQPENQVYGALTLAWSRSF